MPIIIKLQGLPLEASSIDVRQYFLGLTIPDGGVHIVGGDEGAVFIEFASDEDARQAMARGDGTIKNSNIKLLLSSHTEMQTVVEAARQRRQQFIQQQQQQQQQHHQQQQQHQQSINPQQHNQAPLNQQQQQPFIFNTGFTPMGYAMLPQNQHTQQQPLAQPLAQQVAQPLAQPIAQPLAQPIAQTMAQPIAQHQPLSYGADPRLLSQNYQGMLNVINLQPSLTQAPQQPQPMQQQPVPQQLQPPLPSNIQQTDNRARMSGMRGGDDKLFANKRCVLAASNIPYRATSKDIIDFLSEFNIKEDCIRRRYNQKGQPTADAKIAFPTPDAAMKALKMMNKKSLCGRPVFLKPV